MTRVLSGDGVLVELGSQPRERKRRQRHKDQPKEVLGIRGSRSSEACGYEEGGAGKKNLSGRNKITNCRTGQINIAETKTAHAGLLKVTRGSLQHLYQISPCKNPHRFRVHRRKSDEARRGQDGEFMLQSRLS